MEIHENLQKLLQELNISQRQFALALHLDPGYFSRIIQGKTPLIARLQLLIENTYNVNGDWLRTGEGSMFKTQSNSAIRQKVLVEIDRLSDEQLNLLDAFIQYLNTKVELPADTPEKGADK